MSFNLYDEAEEKRPSCEQQYDDLDGDNTQMFDQYYTIHQSPQSQKKSISKNNTGLNKYIKKIKLTKKSKTSQYISEDFIIKRIASLDDASYLNNQLNMNVILQQKDFNKIINKMEQLSIY